MSLVVDINTKINSSFRLVIRAYIFILVYFRCLGILVSIALTVKWDCIRFKYNDIDFRIFKKLKFFAVSVLCIVLYHSINIEWKNSSVVKIA